MEMPNPVDFAAGFEPDSESPQSKWNRLLGNKRPEAIKKQAEDLQREFAQSGVQWRVQDAIKAGIHPLAALGFQGPQASPVIVGDSDLGSDPNRNVAINMGQDFGRAMMASASREDRMLQAMNLASMRLDIEGKAIDNQIRASQLRKLQLGSPAMPSPIDQPGGLSGQGNFQVKPSTAISSSYKQPAQQAGAITDYGFARTSEGGYIPVPSQDVKERIEDNIFHEATHFIRNNILPNFGAGPTPPDPKEYPLPKGFTRWKWHHLKQQFLPARDVPFKWEWRHKSHPSRRK